VISSTLLIYFHESRLPLLEAVSLELIEVHPIC